MIMRCCDRCLATLGAASPFTFSFGRQMEQDPRVGNYDPSFDGFAFKLCQECREAFVEWAKPIRSSVTITMKDRP